MNAITGKLYNEAVEDIEKKIKELLNLGMTQQQVVDFFKSHLKAKESNFYYKQKQPKSAGSILPHLMKEVKADSKAEKIFYDILQERNIRFDFQYTIGPYRADYLIEGFLVIELDGPVHRFLPQQVHDDRRDKYMAEMGYQVLRVPLWILTVMPDVVFKEIDDLLIAHRETKKKNVIKINRSEKK